ncbi:TetR/AcrR family transcriptional regulator [Nocardia cyriacigeorgica]|uniref:TetR/AcrR family transcriptional regulator n=1 Tax=Nocardia cyriacigeorgica TaxID=135487 RepID=UPI0018959F5A|nr:TetR/AcrR family transcriptional regulator [Nocardia cyriacigeorgica]MBF6496330.1 TetR/AcrR family transcriptional regulator [Nocardia cyriacigeorgica]
MTASRAEPTAVSRPARGTRPANRRSLILAAAADLYFRHGYAGVSMRDVADAVAIGPSALYRHFTGKHDLLYAVVADALSTVDAALDGLLADPGADPAVVLAETMLEHRGVGVLWHAEARHLSAEARTELRHQLRGIGARLAEILRRARPGLGPAEADYLSWCVLGVTTSASYYHLELPKERFVGLIAGISRAVAEVPIAALPRPTRTVETTPQWAPNRREAILRTATRLFARHGFAGVGNDDIGAAVGIAGPSIYNHFDSKADILATAMRRGNELLRADMIRQLGRAHSAVDAVRLLITSYCEFVFEYNDLMRLLISETDRLPDDDRRRTRQVQREYIAEWAQLLRQIHPEWDADETRIRIQAAFTVVNDLAATPHLRAIDTIAEPTAAVCRRILEVGEPNQNSRTMVS